MSREIIDAEQFKVNHPNSTSNPPKIPHNVQEKKSKDYTQRACDMESLQQRRSLGCKDRQEKKEKRK